MVGVMRSTHTTPTSWEFDIRVQCRDRKLEAGGIVGLDGCGFIGRVLQLDGD